MCSTIHALALGAALTGCAVGAGEDAALEGGALKLPHALKRKDLPPAITAATLRAQQPWLDDAAFATKLAGMRASPLALLGGASATFHADLGGVPASRLPGDEVLCHGDPKIDNFGWALIDGVGAFVDSDFDDAGPCPVADDALHYLVATALAFADPDLDQAALDAYVATVADAGDATAIDPDGEPRWADVRARGLAKATAGDQLVLGGDVGAASAAERAAVRDRAAADGRFPPTILDVAHVTRTTGGSAGFRRLWLLAVDAGGRRTIVELKELGTPATEAGRHASTLDGPDRFDVLKAYWLATTTEPDHFDVPDLLGARWVARDRLTRTNLDPAALSARGRRNAVAAEASQLALRHRKAWHKPKRGDLHDWLRDSTATLVDRWRAGYAAIGGR